MAEQEDDFHPGGGGGGEIRKRNRWGTEQGTKDASSSSDHENSTNSNSNSAIFAGGGEVSEGSEVRNLEPERKARRSRWEAQDVVVDPHSFGMQTQSLTMTPEQEQQSLILTMQLQHIQNKLLTVEVDALRIGLNPNRDPSPPPRYDKNGARTNTREMRMRESLAKERIKVIEELLKTDPTYKAPQDYVKPKPFRKMYIPVKEHLNTNFVGLIIGPRGNNQRMMETQTNCKISIRGKGSFKEGSKGRLGKSQPDEDDNLHVHIQGEDEENVARAAKMVEDIINTPYDSLEDIKQKQLRELALINGTLREDDYCIICGEKGHKQPECPLRLKSFKQAGVKCANCGDLSHPTRDCPLKEKEATNELILDSEYDSFIAELEGKTATPKTSSSSNLLLCQPVSVSGGQTVLTAPSLTSLVRPIASTLSNNQPAEPGKITTIIAPSLVSIVANPSTSLSSNTVPSLSTPSSSSSSSSSSVTNSTTDVFSNSAAPAPPVPPPVLVMAPKPAQILVAPSLVNVARSMAPSQVAQRPVSIIHAPSLVSSAGMMMGGGGMIAPPPNFATPNNNNINSNHDMLYNATNSYAGFYGYSMPMNGGGGPSIQNAPPPPPPPPRQ